jgi:multiple sugar transport system permease protein
MSSGESETSTPLNRFRPPRQRRHGYFGRKRALDNATALSFLAAPLLAFVLFFGLPILITVGLCLTQYDLISPLRFVGLDNVRRLLRDPQGLTVFKNTLKFLVFLVPAHVIMGLVLAMGVSRTVSKGLQYLYRSAVYFPTVVTTASVAILWGYLYSYNFGAINYLIGLIGIPKVPWLSSASWVIPTVVVFSLWKFVGNSFLFYFIGLQNVPQSYYEAAQIDGANGRQIFFRITLPLLSPTIFFVIVFNCLNSIQIFDEPYFLTKGGPGDASLTVVLHLYRMAFQSSQIGYASIYALALFLIALVLTLVQFNLQKRWVTYDLA